MHSALFITPVVVLRGVVSPYSQISWCGDRVYVYVFIYLTGATTSCVLMHVLARNICCKYVSIMFKEEGKQWIKMSWQLQTVLLRNIMYSVFKNIPLNIIHHMGVLLLFSLLFVLFMSLYGHLVSL